jgi:Tol biopolymer transport system component
MDSEHPAVTKAGEIAGRTGETPLQSWKEIAAYLQRNPVTARRWEKEEGLPVHRHSHKDRSSVYAYTSEIDAWRASRKVVASPRAPISKSRSVLAQARPLVLGALCMFMAGSGIRPQRISAQSPQTSRQVWTGAGVDENALSSDGRYLTYVDQQTGNLALRDLATGTNRILTTDGRMVNPNAASAEMSVISPDSRQIAYLWNMRGKGSELRVVRVDGKAPPRTLHRSAGDAYLDPNAWTPDGKRLLVVSSQGDRTSYQIAMVSVQDGTIRGIKSLPWVYPNPKLSPDGRYIAYALAPDRKSQATDVYVIATDGSSEVAVAQGPSDDAPMAWSTDGSRLLFLSDRTGSPALWSVPIKGGKPNGNAEMVKPDIGAILPLGMASNGAFHYLTPSRSHTNIHSVDLIPGEKAAAEPVLITERFLNSNFGSSLSPDGRHLIYFSYRPGNVSGSDHVMVIRTLETGHERDVTLLLPLRERVGFYGPMWFPDARSVLVTLMEPQKPYLTFYRVDLATGTHEKLYHRRDPVQGFRLSPDGKTIYYSDQASLFRLEIATRKETVVRTGGLINTLAISPDGKQLAYLVSVQPADTEAYLAVMPSTGGEEREIFLASPWGGNRYNALTWAPDQRSLVFAKSEAPGPAVLWQVPLAGGQPERMGIVVKSGVLESPQLHPDGRRIFFTSNETGTREVWALENFLPNAVAK